MHFFFSPCFRISGYSMKAMNSVWNGETAETPNIIQERPILKPNLHNSYSNIQPRFIKIQLLLLLTRNNLEVAARKTEYWRSKGCVYRWLSKSHVFLNAAAVPCSSCSCSSSSSSSPSSSPSLSWSKYGPICHNSPGASAAPSVLWLSST